MPTRETVTVQSILPATAKEIYEAWLDSSEHGEMTGAAAKIDPRVGGAHMAWDEYITGRILELQPGERIVQSWRSSEFASDHTDSIVEVRLRDVDGGCEVTVVHSEIPEGHGAKLEQGWEEFYFQPMKRHFGKRGKKSAKKAAPKKAAKAKKAASKKKAPKKKAAPKAKAKTKAAKKKAKKKR